MPSQPPSLLAMVLCDEIHVDPGTGKQDIPGTHSVLHAREFPTPVPRLEVDGAATDGRDLAPLDLVVADVEGGPIPGLEDRGELDFSGPLAIDGVNFSMEQIPSAEPGE